MKVNLNPAIQAMINAQKAMEMAAKLPQQITEEMLNINQKMIKINVLNNIQSSKIDTYA